MTPVFEALPGIEVAVGEIRPAIAKLWEGQATAGQGAPSEFRASQMNLVLHFGGQVTPDDAVEQFQLALRFAERYPCRLIALVPLPAAPPGTAMRARLYSQCYIGRSRHEMVCTEALAVAYPQDERGYISDLVSTLVEADLPLYYWVHRFTSCRKVADFPYLLGTAQRFVFDSGIAPADALSFPWPRPDSIRDLVWARLLHVRQVLGQFLSGFPAQELAGGLQMVVARHGAQMAPEARCLTGWAAKALVRCAPESAAPQMAVEESKELGPQELELAFRYSSKNYFKWRVDFTPGWAGFDADFGHGRVLHCAAVRLATPEVALGEAFFY